jgi:arginyl-tRNA synthetase
MLAWKKFGNGETPESSGIKGDHLVGKYYVLFDRHYREEVAALVDGGMAKEEAERQAPSMLEIQDMLRQWEAGDQKTLQLWRMMNGWVYEGFDATYATLGVTFDKVYHESETYLTGKKMVEEGLEKGVLFRKEDGSVWIDLTEEGLDQKLLLRADGTSVYITQDLGTALLRHRDYGFDRMIYVVANEQDYHFKVLKLVLKKMGYAWADGIYHLSYGMVDLPSGKMKSREGTVVDADDLLAEMVQTAEEATRELGKLENFDSEEAHRLYRMIGIGALKYFILKVDPKKKMLFNPAESIDLNGNTGPFIQYTHARVRSLVARAEERAGGKPRFNWHQPEVNRKERELMNWLYRYPSVLAASREGYNPSLVANYVYELSKNYNQFYHDTHVLNEEDAEKRSFRLTLTEVTGRVIKSGMTMLGIDVPERM